MTDFEPRRTDDAMPSSEPALPQTDAPSPAPAREAVSPFLALGLAPSLAASLTRLGITAPTPVQGEAIPVLLAGRDLIASAPTGTGKTAAFMLPALQRLVTNPARPGRGPRILVLAPTRELARQVAKASQDFSRQQQRLTTVCITGGESYIHQNKMLSSPYEVLVATPGRLMDQMRSGKVSLDRVEVLVLDEADRMLDMGFADDVTTIAEATPAGRQTVCFTATVSHAIRALANRLLRDPHWLTVERAEQTDSAIDDHVIYVDGPEHRLKLLQACLKSEGLGQAIVFTSTKRHAEELADHLGREGFLVDALHGDMGQRDRVRALNRLRRGECQVLVATDVAARGIDVATITHVINYTLPKMAEDYVHRIGRTGRAGASGQALSFVGADDVLALHRIEHFIGRHVQVSEFEGLEARFRPELRKSRPKARQGRFDPKRGRPSYGKPPARHGATQPAARVNGTDTRSDRSDRPARPQRDGRPPRDARR